MGMRTKKVLSFAAVLVLLCMLLSAVAVHAEAEEPGAFTLDGELYIVGSLEEGGVLYPEFSGIVPGGLDGYEVYYYWSRCVDGQLIGVSQDDVYIVSAEDAGCQIVLTITGKEDMGYTGSLSAWTDTVYGYAEDDGSEYEEEYWDEEEEEDPDKTEDTFVETTERESEIVTEAQDIPVSEDSTEAPSEEETAAEDVPVPVTEAATETTTEDIYVAPAVIDEGEGSETRTPSTEETTVVTTEETISYHLASDYLDLGTFFEGYSVSDVTPVQIVVINDGTKKLSFAAPDLEYGYLDLGGAEGFTVPAGESVLINVYPIEGLDADIYDDTVFLVPLEDSLPEREVHIDFRIVEAESDFAELLNIEEFEEVYISNGTPKTTESFALPGLATIQTTKGAYLADVYWDVEDCDYDPYAEYPQSFTVYGVVVLPEEVVNPDEVDTSISIQVYADGREAFYADADYNGIYGIDADYDGYTTSTKISFSAYGAGMDDTEPVAGDTRYMPTSWQVLETRGFVDESYSSSFRMAEGGDFTLSVVYQQQEFDGSSWLNTGDVDVKEVNFNVVPDPIEETVVEVSPATVYANQVYGTISRGAVQTADETPLGWWITWLLAGFAVTLGITVFQKIRNK